MTDTRNVDRSRRRHLRFAPAINGAAALGLLVGIAGGLYLPAWTGASLAHLNSAVDVLALCGAGIGLAVAVALLLYPLVQLLFRAPPVYVLPTRGAGDDLRTDAACRGGSPSAPTMTQAMPFNRPTRR